MPGTTSNLGLALPVGTDSPSELRIAIGANANTIDGYGLLTNVVTNSVSATVQRGQTVIAAPSTTQTLPAASANALVAIYANGASGNAPVTVAGSKIYGVGLSNVSSFLLATAGAFAILQSNGNSWYIIAGGQNTGWVPLTLSANIGTIVNANVPSVRRDGDTIQFSGQMVNNTGGTMTAGSVWASVPSFAIPTVGVVMPAAVSNSAVTSLFVTYLSGNVTLGASVATSGIAYLEGIGYRIV